jgi:DNA-binding transcriptional LysR family regulator
LKNLEHVEIFKEVVKCGSISKAANRLDLTQPAVSTAITNLESDLGFSLFKRNAVGTSLTAEAEHLLDSVERVLVSVTHFEEVVQELSHGRAGKLHISCMPGFPSSSLVSVISKFVKENPSLNIALKIHSSEKIHTGVRPGHFDLGIAEIPSKSKGLDA